MNLILKLLFRANRFIIWLQNKLTPKQFLIFSAILIGLTAGLAAVLLKWFVHSLILHIGHFSQNKQSIIAFFPVVGIILSTLFVIYFNRGKLGKGLSNILYAIARRSSLLPRDQTYSHIITGGLTVGFGGSTGIESPIVTTGSAIGSNFGMVYKLGYKERTLLLACGAAAGIAGAFNTPIAGVLFALEVLLVEANISAFIPILIAAATGGLCSKIILHEDILLVFRSQELFDYHNVPFYFLLGLLTGFISFYYSKTFLFFENYFNRLKNKTILKIMIGGSGLYILIVLFPPLVGEGYNSIKLLAEQKTSLLFSNSILGFENIGKTVCYILLLLIILLKPIATAFTVGGGGNGGNFAPSLFVGAFCGFLFSRIITDLGFELPTGNFTLVGMAGILTGIFHAPLTGIFLIAEITGGYDLIIPLMIVSALSYTVSKYFMPLSIDMLKLEKKEQIVTTTTDSYLLSNIRIKDLIETDFTVVKENATLKNIIQHIADSRRNVFPVTDEHDNLAGLISIDDIRGIMFKPDLHDKISVKQLMQRPRYVITEKHDVSTAMKMFDESHLWNLPVVLNNKYAGFISKSSILERYRNVLVQTSIE
jgi:CIC family chloride channel protein